MILVKIAIFATCVAFTMADDDKKWVWGDNSRDGSKSSERGSSRGGPEGRYEVFEDERPFSPNYQKNEFDRPQGPNTRPFSGGSKPQQGFLPNIRPNGVYGGGNYEESNSEFLDGPDFIVMGNTKGGDHLSGGIIPDHHSYRGPYYHGPDGPNSESGILSGPVPSWSQVGQYKKFDKCKCTEKFNCNTPGVSYGHCDVGKQYCCYFTNSKHANGGPPPLRPVHSLENGILVGPGGPVDPVPGMSRPRPIEGGPIGGPNAYQRPNFQRPALGFYGRPRPNESGPNTYSPENGILVGPTGPFDRPPIRGYGRPGKRHI